jgi:hypothetical protein
LHWWISTFLMEVNPFTESSLQNSFVLIFVIPPAQLVEQEKELPQQPQSSTISTCKYIHSQLHLGVYYLKSKNPLSKTPAMKRTDVFLAFY